MDTTRQDFVVGLLIVGAIAVVVGTLLATSGWGERRYPLFLRAANAEGLTTDSKVILQGLEVGRVVAVSPRADAVTQRVTFVAKLTVAERFADGSSLRLPVGTRASLEQVNQISPAVAIVLVLPDSVGRGTAMLAAGDTIASERKAPVLDQVADVATQLSKEVVDVLHAARHTLDQVRVTVAQADQTLRTLTPDAHATLASLASTMRQVDRVVARIDPGVGDTVTAALTQATQSLRRLDTLMARTNAMTAENRRDIRETVANIAVLTRQLNHLADELSRRPYRFLTGVRPLTFDTTLVVDSTPAPRAAGDSTKP